MKKLIVILLLIFSVFANAQDFSGLKILIYPGGISSQEKIDNYEKGKFYKKILKTFGAKVTLIDNREHDIPLSQLAAVINQNKIDFVHSIQSNDLITTENENYSLVIHNSFKNFDIEDAGELVLDGVSNSNRTDNKYLSGEYDNELSGNFFLGFNSPALVSIGSKSSLEIEKNNYKNKDFLKNEVWGYVRGLINFFETKPYTKGFIAGFVRDKNEKIVDLINSEEYLKPVNNIKVTLQPGNKIYVGDFNNNGFFYFDSLEPGEYKIIYEAGSYSKDSSIVTVASNQTTYADKLLEKDFSIPPSVFDYSPNDTSKLTDTESQIKIVFSIPMDQESTEDAFSIEPEIDGNFEWSNEDHILNFIPDKYFDKSTEYKIIIDTTAKGKNNINLKNRNEFSFLTKEYFVEAVFNNPDSASDSLITTQPLSFEFTKKMDRDETEDAFSIEPEIEGRFIWSDDNTKLTFIPDEAYLTSTKYTAVISDEAETYNGLELGYDFTVEFVTKSLHIRPQLIAVSPADTVYINSNIAAEFDEPMNTESVQESFVISPQIEGRFEWNESKTQFTFIPSKLLTPGMEYKVDILTSAKNSFGINLEKELQFNFTTNKRGGLQLLSSYPSSNQKDISNSSKIKIVLNYPVETEKLSSNVSLLTSSGKAVNLINFYGVEKDEKYVVYFEPAVTLSKDAEYNMYISKELKDEFGIPLLDDVSISFKTEPNISFAGSVVENFEETGKWIKIDSNKATNGIEKEKTFFEKSGEQKISGDFSGRIVYQFNKDKASLKLEKPQAINLSNSGGEAGIWIYGDLSNNLFTVKLITDNSESFDVVIDTLNWSGWKFKKFSLSNFASRNIYLKNFGIKRTQNGEAAGEIYFDDLQISKAVVSAEAEESIPSEFTLEQNFPNPFNPTTTISFKIPTQSVVTLDVLNILGQKVRSLIHKENYSAGTWSVEWDGKSDYGEFMPSGVYLYKIKTANFTEVKKMILIK